MELTKVGARRVRDYIVNFNREITRLFELGIFPPVEKQTLDEKYFIQHYNEVGDMTEKIYNYIVINDDVDMAKVFARIKIGQWFFVFRNFNQVTDESKPLYFQILKAIQGLYEIQRWYMEMVYNIPVEDISEGKYIIGYFTGEVTNTATGEILHAPLLEYPKETPQETPQDAEITLPEGLHTDEAIKVFKRAIQAGLMEKQDNGFKWHLSNALLAYFCGRLYCEDRLITTTKKEEKIVEKGGNSLPARAIEIAFGISRISQSHTQIIGLIPPKGYKKIDRLFD